MSYLRIGSAVVIGLALIGAGGLYHWQQGGEGRLPTQVLTTGPVTLVLALNGRVAARNEVTVTPPISAHIAKVLVDEGDKVSAGATLIELDSSIVEAQLLQARAAVAAQVAARDQARDVAQRAQSLGTNTISRASLEEAQNSLNAAQAQLDRFEFALEEAELQRDRYTLRAPMDAVVTARKVEIGQFVTTQDQLLVLASADQPVIEADVDELYGERILLGQNVVLHPLGMDHTLTGAISFVAPSINETTGGRKVKITLEAPPKAMAFGLTVNANIIVEDYDAALTVPRSAIAPDGAVYVQKADHIEKVYPQVLDWPAERLVVQSGLTAGDELILDPQAAALELARLK